MGFNTLVAPEEVNLELDFEPVKLRELVSRNVREMRDEREGDI